MEPLRQRGHGLQELRLRRVGQGRQAGDIIVIYNNYIIIIILYYYYIIIIVYVASPASSRSRPPSR